MRGWRYRNHPTGQSVVNRPKASALGLVSAWLLSESAGSAIIFDELGTANINVLGTATWDADGLRCDANDEGAEVTAPSNIRLNPPLTFGAWFMPIGTPTQFAGCFGVTYDNAAGEPWLSYALDFNDPFLRILFNAAGTFTAGAQASISAYLNERILAVGVIKSGSQKLYINGIQQAESTATIASISYGASALITFGDYAGIARNSNAVFYAGFICNRELVDTEVWQLYDAATRWDLIEPVVGRMVGKAPTAVVDFPPIPAQVHKMRSNPIYRM